MKWLRIGISGAVLVVALAQVAGARTFCMVKVHGKGGQELADRGWAEDYWFNGQFQSIAQPCDGMPALTTHADGTAGSGVAFDTQYCGCGITSWYGCKYLYTPQAGMVDPGQTGPWPANWAYGWVNTTTDGNGGTWPSQNQCIRSGPYEPRQFPTPPYWQGVIEQIYAFMQQNGCTDIAVVTHSMGANVIRWAFSQGTYMYDASQCKDSNGSRDPGCLRLRDHLIAVQNTVSTVMAMHAPHLGSEAATVAKYISGQWYGFVLDWVAPYDLSTYELTIASMARRNSVYMYGTAGRPWPLYADDGYTPLRVPNWISLVSPISGSQIVEDGGHADDYGLYAVYQAVNATSTPWAGGYSDGLVSLQSMAGVGTVWYFQGQHDHAANAYPTQSSWRGNNHSDDRLGAAGGGRWTPLYFKQEPSYYAPGISPPFLGPGGSDCFGTSSDFYCIGWPWPSTSHGVAVPACPDASCKANFTRGNPDGADEAFAISAYLQARVAAVCGPAITQQSVWNGQSRTVWKRMGSLSNAYWQAQYSLPLYDYYYPTAGSRADHDGPPQCNWSC
jgi:hypothetical protein